MELNDNTFAFVPISGGVVRAGMPDARVCFKLGTVPSSQQQTMEWCQQNVKRLVPGFLSVGDKTGALGANLKAAGVPARISPVNGASLTSLAVHMDGLGMRDDYGSIDEAVAAVGGVWRAWSGAAAMPRLHVAAGIATLADAQQA